MAHRLNNRRVRALGIPLAAMLFIMACSATPYTGRKRLMLTTEQQENAMGAESYKEFMGKATPSSNRAYIDLVTRVGTRLAAAANRPDYAWEFEVVESKEINAWCLPGGKIVFYTGIMKLFDNEAEIAAVMGHEIAHAVLRHGGERMSQGLVIQALGTMLESMTETSQNRALYMLAFGGISNVGVLLPFSRKHEYEADRTGTMLMAKSGYDPDAATAFWKKMIKLGGTKTPEFLSTHPADGNRVKALAKVSGEMRGYYTNAPQRYGLGEKI